jgi:hypothetical protein
MRILIASPVHRPLDLNTFISFVRLANYRSPHHTYDFMFVQNSLVYQARDSIATAFLQSGHDALVMIDSDMTFHHEAIDRLAAFDKPFVTAKAFKRVPPYQPCFYTKVDIGEDGKAQLQVPIQYQTNTLLEIEGAGMACVFIKREVFEKIEGPYFDPLPGLGEDLTFCYKVKQAGFPMYCDTGMQFGHVGTQEFGEEHFVAYLRQKEAEGADLQKIYT